MVYDCWVVSHKYWSLIEEANRMIEVKTTLLNKVLLWFAARLLKYYHISKSQH